MSESCSRPDDQSQLKPGAAFELADLVQVQPCTIVSRVLAKSVGGTLTLFAFAEGQELSEHSAPFDAVVQVIEGALDLTIAGNPVRLEAGGVVVMPADVPHALAAPVASKMLLTMLKG